MSAGDEYSRRAAICFAFADLAKDAKLQAELYALAKLWVCLADQAERNSRGGRLPALEPPARAS